MRLTLRIKGLLDKLLDVGVDAYVRRSYSQEGEDLLLSRIFHGQDRGLYVDVGAHHPRRFSNTHLFYRRGWSGINIEPNPDALRDFQTERKRDVNLRLGISDRPGQLTYYCFDDPALNTFDPDVVESRLADSPYRVVRAAPVPVERLEDVLSRHLPAGRAIDFLTVDVEGRDLVVLKSNDWRRFRPRLVLVESIGQTLREAMDGEVGRFMEAQGYRLFAKTLNTLFFRRDPEGDESRGRPS